MPALLLDLDGTLIDEHAASTAAFEAFFAPHRAGLANDGKMLATWRAISARHWMRYELGEVAPGAKPRYDTVLKVLGSLGVRISVSAVQR
jgi:hypothetical protein